MMRRFMLLLGIIFFYANTVFSQCNMIIDQDFNHWNNRKYTVADAKSDFNNKVKPWTASTYRGISAPGADASLIGDVKQETWVVNGELRAEYTKDDAGGYAGGFLFDPYFDGVEEAYLEYKVKFDDNFFWATGGKLPGLGGSTQGINSETTGRGAIPSGGRYDENGSGFSARLMWRRNRDQTDKPYFILYSYFAEKPDGSARKDGEAGDAIRIYSGLQDQHWYTIRQYIKLNTPGQDNGTVIMWVDGVEVYKNNKHNIRQAGRGDLKINALIMNTYRGGSRTDPVWHSPRDEYAFFDDFKVWTNCSDPGNTVNEAPLVSFDPGLNTTLEEGYEALYVLANATDSDGSVAKVELYIDGTFVRQESVAPYEWGHANSPNPMETVGLSVGTHELKVIARDDDGAESVATKTITVTRVNKAPEVQIISPFDKEIFYIGEEITIRAQAMDDRAVEKVNFKLNGAYHSQDQTAIYGEYSTTMTFSSAGMYTIGARAFDGEGGSTEVSVKIEIRDEVITQNLAGRDEQFRFYPNPTHGEIHLSASMPWTILNMQGVEILSGQGDFINLSVFGKGVFILRVEEKVYKVMLE